MSLETDLTAMTGVWHDILTARDIAGAPLPFDPHGGVPGPFPYENLVYVQFEPDSGLYRQTNVTFRGREPHARTFEADVSQGILRFRRLGPDAPQHVGISAGPGLIWFVSEQMGEEGLKRYCEPDFIRLEGNRRTRDTVLWRAGTLVRTLHVEGHLLTTEVQARHPLDPRGPEGPVHEPRASTQQYRVTSETPRP